MYHYVYLLTFDNGMSYIGAHSTTIKPELDTCYLGSGRALPERTPQSCTKEIVEIFNTRAEAINYEEKLIELNNAVKSPYFYNLRKRVHDKHGSKLSSEHVENIRKQHTGRDRSEYGKKYTGEGRTPAQKAGDIANGLRNKGVKNPAKGLLGIKNNGFVPWYYITPLGAYHEIHDRTKEELAESLGFTKRQLQHAFHYTNQHKEAKTRPRKGWTFGNLPRPKDITEA